MSTPLLSVPNVSTITTTNSILFNITATKLAAAAAAAEFMCTSAAGGHCHM